MDSTGYDSSFPIFRCSPDELMNAFASVVSPADERASRLRQKCREDFRVDTSDRADLTLSPADPYYNMPLGRPIMAPERVSRDTTGSNRSTGKVGLYIQTCLETPDTLIQPLHEYMCKATKVLGEISWWDLTARLQLITPIIAQVCLRGPDITFIDNSHLIQEYDFRDPSFQFVIRRGSVTVGVLASGCGLIQEKHMLEAVSARKRLVEQTGWDVPYVIVTTYFQWNYMYFGDDGKLAIDRSCLEILSSLPTWRSLGQVLGKIAAMLI